LHLDSVFPVTVFDFKESGKNPSVFLAVTIKISSETQRIASIKIKNEESGFCWFSDNPDFQLRKNQNENDKSGYIYIKCSPSDFDGKLPCGNYSATVKDLGGNEVELSFYVEYDQKFLSLTDSGITDTVSAFSKYYALFSQNDDLLYYVKEQNIKTDSVFSVYRDAVYMRMCYVDSKETVVCIMPSVIKK